LGIWGLPSRDFGIFGLGFGIFYKESKSFCENEALLGWEFGLGWIVVGGRGWGWGWGWVGLNWDFGIFVLGFGVF
jgi:hypothetical protein